MGIPQGQIGLILQCASHNGLYVKLPPLKTQYLSLNMLYVIIQKVHKQTEKDDKNGFGTRRC